MTRLGPAARAGLSTVAGTAVGAVMTALAETVTWPLVSGLAACVLAIITLEYWSRRSTTPDPQPPRRTSYEQIATGRSQIINSGGSATGGAEVKVTAMGGSAVKDSPVSARGDSQASQVVDDHSTVEGSPIDLDGDTR